MQQLVKIRYAYVFNLEWYKEIFETFEEQIKDKIFQIKKIINYVLYGMLLVEVLPHPEDSTGP